MKKQKKKQLLLLTARESMEKKWEDYEGQQAAMRERERKEWRLASTASAAATAAV
jgi:hypothetical protein